jgi:hypothetical protein
MQVVRQLVRLVDSGFEGPLPWLEAAFGDPESSFKIDFGGVNHRIPASAGDLRVLEANGLITVDAFDGGGAMVELQAPAWVAVQSDFDAETPVAPEYDLDEGERHAVRGMVDVVRTSGKRQFVFFNNSVAHYASFADETVKVDVRRETLMTLEREGMVALDRKTMAGCCGRVSQAAIEAVKNRFRLPSVFAPVPNVGVQFNGGTFGAPVQAVIGNGNSLNARGADTAEVLSQFAKLTEQLIDAVLSATHDDPAAADAAKSLRTELASDQLALPTLLQRGRTMMARVLDALDGAAETTDRIEKVAVASAKWVGWLTLLASLAHKLNQ